jgi:hypothetical protein
MPFVFIIVGIVLLTSGARGTSADLQSLLVGDLTGSNNFSYWIFAILVIGAIGYIQDLRGLSRAFLVLVILVLFLKEGSTQNPGGGFFAEFQSAFNSITGKAA